MPDFQTSFYFSLAIGNDSSESDAAFQEVSGLNAQLDVEEVVSGGENRFKYRLPTTTTYPNLILKRGVASAPSPLVAWCARTLGDGLASPITCKDLLLSLLDKNGQTTMSWSFLGAYPVKWAINDLKSQESNILIETIELVYRYVSIADPRAKPR
ncbi:MAG: phage tail protein [Rhodocyclaceae bacterium]|nr:phage tail protein [Rhodocyclaceae bacterium]